MHDFTGKVALVTGSSTGVGEIIALTLLEQGATVIITARKESELLKTMQKYASFNNNITAIVMDVRDPKSVNRTINQISDQFGKLDFLINNAGITGPHNVPIWDYDIKDWQDVIDTDLTGMFYCMKYSIPLMLKSGGAIVNLSAVNGIIGIAGIAPYTSAKHAVIGLTQAVALELAEKGIRVNAVAPGYIHTPQISQLPDDVKQYMANSHPMKRMATCQEVAKLVSFLLSEDSSFTTGAIYSIDGGYTAQ